MFEDSAGNEGSDQGQSQGQAPQIREPNSVDELPKWAQDQLKKARNDAANNRATKDEAVNTAKQEAAQEAADKIAELENAKATAVADLENARLESMKLQTALSVGIPGESAADFAELLQGSTEEELRDHAEKVKGLMGHKPDRAVDPSQGSQGDTSNGTDAGAMLANFIRSQN